MNMNIPIMILMNKPPNWWFIFLFKFLNIYYTCDGIYKGDIICYTN